MSNLAQAMVDDIAALESMEDPGHIMDLHICIPRVAAGCGGCRFDMGTMGGGCCAGLREAARRHHTMYKSGLCSKACLAKRCATLAWWLKKRLLDQICEEPVSFLPPCRWADSAGSCTWCTNVKCKKYFNGPCSKRCAEAEE